MSMFVGQFVVFRKSFLQSGDKCVDFLLCDSDCTRSSEVWARVVVAVCTISNE